jgi:hypothetical protein
VIRPASGSDEDDRRSTTGPQHMLLGGKALDKHFPASNSKSHPKVRCHRQTCFCPFLTPLTSRSGAKAMPDSPLIWPTIVVLITALPHHHHHLSSARAATRLAAPSSTRRRKCVQGCQARPERSSIDMWEPIIGPRTHPRIPRLPEEPWSRTC